MPQVRPAFKSLGGRLPDQSNRRINEAEFHWVIRWVDSTFGQRARNCTGAAGVIVHIYVVVGCAWWVLPLDFEKWCAI